MTTTEDFTSGHPPHDTQTPHVAGDSTSEGHGMFDTQPAFALGSASLTATSDTVSTTTSQSGSNFTSGHRHSDTQNPSAAGDQSSPTASTVSIPKIAVQSGSDFRDDQSSVDTQWVHIVSDQPIKKPDPILADPLLGVFADILDDFEKVRIANENRLRQLTDTGEHGHGLTMDNPELIKLAALVEGISDFEHQAILALQRTVRKHPLGIWAKPIVGIGEKQLARLLAAIRDPYWNDLHDRPRTVSELWAFCGYHVVKVGGQTRDDTHVAFATHSQTSGSQIVLDAQPHHAAGSASHIDQASDNTQDGTVGVAPKRQRGQQANWKGIARDRCYLIAESCIKQANSPYRKVYDDTRAHYADAVHDVPCVRCGPKGKPAPVGSPLSLGHQHARGLRKVAKTILRDLWREAKRLHELED